MARSNPLWVSQSIFFSLRITVKVEFSILLPSLVFIFHFRSCREILGTLQTSESETRFGSEAGMLPLSAQFDRARTSGLIRNYSAGPRTSNLEKCTFQLGRVGGGGFVARYPDGEVLPSAAFSG
ncbi:hypothetical protein V6N11_059251 [Hibiscus sabdariffa]|uniref:Uncharacterized protein n=1 Tax=Hibiscus sabdariffa TaxID=183260 RepID=A0ABR2U788_9ROSI